MSDVDRARLIEAHLELPRKAARMIHPRVARYVELDELIALGNAGLTEAAGRYDPAQGASFATFAWYRVNGAIIDGLRRMTSLPRRTWAKLVALRAAGEYLENRGERDAGATQRGAPARTMEDSLRAIKDAIAAIQTVYLTSLDELRDEGHEMSAPAAEPAEERLDRDRLAARLRAALAALPERERALVTKHYYEGKNLLEAGAELGISRSWASRLHAQAVDRLRAVLAMDDTAPP